MHRSVRLGLVFLATALVVSCCGSIGPGRNSSGTTTSKRIDAAGVSRLDVAYGFDVRVRPGKLRIQLQPGSNLDNRPTLRAEVMLARLQELRAAGASTVTVDGGLSDSNLQLLVSGSSRVAVDLALNQVDATVSGSSHLQLSGTANALSVQGSGASRLDLADLRLHDLNIKLSGASHGSVQVDRRIAAQLSGASMLTYKGTPQFTRRETSGGSSLEPA